MPEPKENEKRSAYINRATRFMIKEEGLKRDHAVAKAYGMWAERQKKVRELAKRKIKP